MIIPGFLTHLPVWQGLPVPYTVWINKDGTPDFRVIDHGKKELCMSEYLCAICGRRLGSYGWFVGGEKSLVENSLFMDPPQHEHCARFAIEACPFLSGKITEASDLSVRPAPAEIANPLVSAHRSKRIGMRRARRKDYRRAMLDGYAVIKVVHWSGSPIWLA